jgi:hypothetical protein
MEASFICVPAASTVNRAEIREGEIKSFGGDSAIQTRNQTGMDRDCQDKSKAQKEALSFLIQNLKSKIQN